MSNKGFLTIHHVKQIHTGFVFLSLRYRCEQKRGTTIHVDWWFLTGKSNAKTLSECNVGTEPKNVLFWPNVFIERACRAANASASVVIRLYACVLYMYKYVSLETERAIKRKQPICEHCGRVESVVWIVFISFILFTCILHCSIHLNHSGIRSLRWQCMVLSCERAW